jgi:hypothetical protein
MYIIIWNEFKNFCSSYLDIATDRIPIYISTLSVFLASLFQKCLAAATLSTYSSAIGYVHKLNGVQDPTTSFFILKLPPDAKRSRVQVDTRLPITRSILHRMLVALPYICSSPFYQILYRSMFLLAFYGFLRVGEMTRNLGQVDSHCLLISAFQFLANGLTISFISYKHSVPGKIVKLFVSKQVNQEMRPVVVLQRYLAVRGDYGGCLFVHPIGSPISRSQFTDILQKTLSFRDRPFHLKGGLRFFVSFRIFFSDNTRVRIKKNSCRAKREFFFQNLTLGDITKTLNQIIIFFSNIGNQNIFLEKKPYTPPSS